MDENADKKMERECENCGRRDCDGKCIHAPKERHRIAAEELYGCDIPVFLPGQR